MCYKGKTGAIDVQKCNAGVHSKMGNKERVIVEEWRAGIEGEGDKGRVVFG